MKRERRGRNAETKREKRQSHETRLRKWSDRDKDRMRGRVIKGNDKGRDRPRNESGQEHEGVK